MPADRPIVNINPAVQPSKAGHSKPATIGDVIHAMDAEFTSLGFVLGAVFEAGPKNANDALQAIDRLRGELSQLAIKDAEQQQIGATARSVRNGLELYQQLRG